MSDSINNKILMFIVDECRKGERWGTIDENDSQKLLGISLASAVPHFKELEKKGIISLTPLRSDDGITEIGYKLTETGKRKFNL